MAQHEGFLRHRRFYWLKAGLLLGLLSLVGYIAASVPPGPYGGTWYGYTLGTIGAGLIVWLSLLGIRKRAMTKGRWSLKAWTSAHVYLGLALIIVATLHSGFHFGWNVHTLAYGLMMLVIASGAFGIAAYATLPAALSNSREDQTQPQMIDGIRAIDRLLKDAAQPLPTALSQAVQAAIDQSPFAGGLLTRLSGRNPSCATAAAIATLEASKQGDPATIEPVERLLIRRKAQLARIRQTMRLRALLEIWLYVHVPATIALLAALIAHIISVFYYW
jgi:hypothetical protein